ncbi:MAG: hypothetical protein K5639_00355 [Eubacterium sp.]|nr:hypothetical protein [Eubacterium sp.]
MKSRGIIKRILAMTVVACLSLSCFSVGVLKAEQSKKNLIVNNPEDLVRPIFEDKGKGPRLGSRGDGTKNSPYVISNADELLYLSEQVEKGYSYAGDYIKLGADIDLTGFKPYKNDIVNSKMHAKDTWKPIGGYYEDGIGMDKYTYERPFAANFSGDWHTIKGLKISGYSSDIGVFGLTKGINGSGKIEDLNVVGELSGNNYVGGIVGYNGDGFQIVECTFRNSSVKANGEGAGGIAGLSKGIILGCAVNYVKVNALQRWSGGICGCAECNIEKSYASGNIDGAVDVGGVVGELINRNNGNNKIFKSNSECTVKGDWYIGGIAGMNEKGTLDTCINYGSITGTDFVGGVCGKNTGTVKECKNVRGKVTGDRYVGDLIGADKGENASVTASVFGKGDTRVVVVVLIVFVLALAGGVIFTMKRKSQDV